MSSLLQLNQASFNERFTMNSWGLLEERVWKRAATKTSRARWRWNPRCSHPGNPGRDRGGNWRPKAASMSRRLFRLHRRNRTGAIIAAGLSIGMTSAELLQFYREAGGSMFEKSALLERFEELLHSRSAYPSDPNKTFVFVNGGLTPSSRLD